MVKRRDTDAVAFDVSADGAGTGERGKNTGARGRLSAGCLPFGSDVTAGGGWSSSIFLRDSIVCTARGPSSDESDDEGVDSSIVGVIGRGSGCGDDPRRLGVTEREREEEDRRLIVCSGELYVDVREGDRDADARLPGTKASINDGCDARGEGPTDDEREDEERDEVGRTLRDERRLYAGVVGSDDRPVGRGDTRVLEVPETGEKLETWELDRRPIVDGRRIEYGSEVDSVASPTEDSTDTYCVRARGGGNTGTLSVFTRCS